MTKLASSQSDGARSDDTLVVADSDEWLPGFVSGDARFGKTFGNCDDRHGAG